MQTESVDYVRLESDQDPPAHLSAARDWSAKQLVDACYEHYANGGFGRAVHSAVCQVLGPALALLMVWGLFAVLDWHAIWYGTELLEQHAWLKHPTYKSLLILALLGAILFVVTVVPSILAVRRAYYMARVFKDTLHLTDRTLVNMTWTDLARTVAERLPTLLGYHGTQWHHVCQLKSVESNYMLAVHQNGILSSRMRRVYFGTTMVQSSTFNKCLWWCLSHLWSQSTSVMARPSLACHADDVESAQHASALRTVIRRFRCVGVGLFIAWPVLLVAQLARLSAMVIFASKVSTSDSDLVSLTWTTAGVQHLRCLDEVECDLEARLQRALPRVQKMRAALCAQRPSATLALALRALQACLVVVIVLSLVDARVNVATLWPITRYCTWAPNPLVVCGWLAIAVGLVYTVNHSHSKAADKRRTRIPHLVQALNRHIQVPRGPSLGFAFDLDWMALERALPDCQERCERYDQALAILSALTRPRWLDMLAECLTIAAAPAWFCLVSDDTITELVMYIFANSRPIAIGCQNRFILSACEPDHDPSYPSATADPCGDIWTSKLNESRLRFST